MKKPRFLAVLALITVGIFSSACSTTGDTSARTPSKPVLRHVVHFGFKESATPEKVREIVDAFRALPSQISQIKAFEWGVDCSPEGLQKGLTHTFFLTFESAADRDAYLVHPAHKKFGQVLNGNASAVTVLDYWAEK